jgi:alpha-galactosidase
MNPFAMVTRGEASEEKGEVYSFSPVTSGNWLIESELFRDGSLRVNVGLNDFAFKWRLTPGKAFITPECVMAFSAKGFSNLSLNLHRFVRDRIVGGFWQKKPRPMLINNWEATYFKFDQEKLLKIAKAGKEAGLELFVLDDGWFGKRDNDTTSLGDWTVDRRKLPEGLRGISDRIHGLGMKFGLWIEPEMISPKSDLYRKHPDWCLHTPGRVRRGSRSQLVLDMSRAEVRDHLLKVLSAALDEARVDYVKWDMNRSLSEVGSPSLSAAQQGEVYFRYVMGVYDLMDRLNQRFPKVLFEGCSGGGARFDMGVLNYHPQIWTSDNTDGLERLKIQYATSFAYPPLVMGAHISSVPNHYTHRSLSLKWRALVSMSGNFGVEADLTKWSMKDRKELAGYVSLYKEIRPLVQFGDFYRLESPFAGPRAAWMFVSPQRSEALLFAFQTEPWKKGTKVRPIRLRGLAPLRNYSIEGTGKFKGDRLMGAGFLPTAFRSPSKKFTCELFHLKG